MGGEQRSWPSRQSARRPYSQGATDCLPETLDPRVASDTGRGCGCWGLRRGGRFIQLGRPGYGEQFQRRGEDDGHPRGTGQVHRWPGARIASTGRGGSRHVRRLRTILLPPCPSKDASPPSRIPASTWSPLLARGSSACRTDLAEVRSWGRQQGFQVSDRGGVPAELIAAFDDAR